MYVGSTLGYDEAAINSNYCLALRLSPLRLMPAIHSSSKSIIPQQQLRKLADSTSISGFCIRKTLTYRFELLRRVSHRKGLTGSLYKHTHPNIQDKKMHSSISLAHRKEDVDENLRLVWGDKQHPNLPVRILLVVGGRSWSPQDRH